MAEKVEGVEGKRAERAKEAEMAKETEAEKEAEMAKETAIAKEKEMAKGAQKNGEETQPAAVKPETVQERALTEDKVAMQESVYTIPELAAGAGSLFGTRPECVAAALKAAGKSAYTAAEAKRIIDRFLKREVK